MGAAIPLIGLALGAVGTGISYYGQQQAAKTQAQFAMLNAQAQQAQAQMQGNTARAQAQMQAVQTQQQQKLAQVNAQTLRGEAESAAAAARVNISRQMDDQRRFRSMIQARAGASGTVAGQGSQLDILLQTAELQTLENAEYAYQTEIQRRSLFRQAEGARLGAEQAGIQAGLDIMGGEARASAYRAQGVQAQLAGLGQVASARGASLSALGAAAQGFGQLGFQAYNLNRQGAFG